MRGEPTFDAERTADNEVERLKMEFSRPVTPENIPLIEKIRLHTQPGETSSGGFGLEVFGEMPDTYGLGHKFKAALETGDLTKKGEFYRQLIQGRDFIDLACGDPSWSPVPRAVAKTLEAKRYIGVDKYALADADKRMRDKLVPVVDRQSGYALQNTLGPVHVENEGGFEFSWIQDDMLGFVSKIKDTNGAVFFLAGVQEYDTNEQTQEWQTTMEYFGALGREMSRVTHNGDSIIFSGVTPATPLIEEMIKHGFRQLTKEELEQVGFTNSIPTILIKE